MTSDMFFVADYSKHLLRLALPKMNESEREQIFSELIKGYCPNCYRALSKDQDNNNYEHCYCEREEAK